MIDSDLKISSARITANAISLGLGDDVQAAHQDQLAIEKALKADKTKTRASKDLFASQTASKRLKQIWKKTCQKQDAIRNDLQQFQKKIDANLSINSTTDLVILNSYSAMLKDMNISQITSLVREGDIDAARAALLVPALRLSEKFRNAQDLLKSELITATLGDDLKTYTDLQKQLETADRLEIAVLETSAAYDKKVAEIESTIVKAEVQNIDTDETLQPAVG